MVLKGAVLVNTTDDTEVCSNLEQTNGRIMILSVNRVSKYSEV